MQYIKVILGSGGLKKITMIPPPFMWPPQYFTVIIPKPPKNWASQSKRHDPVNSLHFKHLTISSYHSNHSVHLGVWSRAQRRPTVFVKRIWICIEADDFFTPFSLFKTYITNHCCVHLGELHMMMMIAFITIKSDLVPLIECLCAHISYFRFEICRWFAFTSFAFLFGKKNMLKKKAVSPRSHPAS